MASTIDRKAISELQGICFEIPSQQRGYKWTKDNVDKLLEDFKFFIDKDIDAKFYCMQPLAVVEVEEGKRYKVLDGQQRLTTIYLLNKFLNNDSEIYSFVFETDKDSDRLNYLRGQIPAKNDKSINEFYITVAYNAIKDWFGQNPSMVDVFKIFLSTRKEERSAQFIWYKVDAGKEHEVFENLNSGKLSLTTPELIKAILMSPNSNMSNREQAIMQFEEMQRMLRNDRFWYMLQNDEPGYRKSRMDLIFNLALGISNSTYSAKPNAAFDIFYDNLDKTEELWKKVRKAYLRLVDFYENPYSYHYIGYLTYCRSSSCLHDVFSLRETNGSQEFIEKLRDKVSNAAPKDGNHKKVSDFVYPNEADKRTTVEMLRRLLLLYNIESILSRYQNMHDEHKMRFSYEQFPFDLLYKQNWDIEHIASQTENDFRKPQDRDDWLEAYAQDSKHIDDVDIAKLKQAYEKTKKKEDFDALYRLAIKKEDDDLKGQKVEDKHQIGNLVLLDSHTNRSFHNSLYPRKRAIVIIADGNKCEDDRIQNVKTTYVPLCTKNVFMKYYNKNAGIINGAWTIDDCNAYRKDIASKLDAYYENE